MIAYYKEAIPRAFYAALNWALGQGWMLSLLLAVGVVVSAALFAFVRAWRGHHSWLDAVRNLRTEIASFVLVFVGGSTFVMGSLFFGFLLADPPNQIAAANLKVKTLLDENNSLKAEISARNSKGIF